MSTSIVVNGAVTEYSDEVWTRLYAGKEDAPADILRYIIEMKGEILVQMLDEWEALVDLYDQERERVKELEKKTSRKQAKEPESVA
jgi:hypothetical protein